ncbi:hypothetical protein CXK91_00015 [Stutzerimonas stutzeri]|uniref:DUF2059 domain-containing protein n=1 Tax=Stutzerimonas stutzeri TaxID=316 RepID=A0A2S4AT15_STUST|nr:DUF2059 domain-containing protein [Stutzerimonas stutzeri]MCQ4264302.1 DUF2059 domain-containing protein [Stutzerimonas stutzeri]POH84402.1 hypothetical protein CXK91_00015 [Stutzerimonas stutzeri]
MPTFRIQALRCAMLFICASSSAFADNAGHERSAERFLQLANADRLAVPVYAQVQQMFAQRFAETQAPENKKAMLERYQAQANAALDKAIGWDKLKPDLVSLYTSHFSEAELNQLIDFYQSPLGKKMLTKLPELNARSAQLTQVKLEAVVPEVNKLLSDMTAELENQKP